MDENFTPRRMKSVGDLFEKYRTRLRAPQATVEKACVRTIAEVTGFSVTEEQVVYTVHTRTITIHAPSLIKSELRFHHDVILKNLEEELGAEGCPKTIL